VFFVLEAKKRDHENSEGLVRRFTRIVQQSGVLLQAKKVRYYEPKKSKNRIRVEAQRRGELQAERDRMIKMGEIDEFSFPNKKGKRW
jgi:ribosomal protein S21